MPPLTDGPHAGDTPTVLQSADVVELNRALAQRDARIAELERALREWSELAEHLDLSTQSHRNRTRDLLASTPAPEHPDTRRLDSARDKRLKAEAIAEHDKHIASVFVQVADDPSNAPHVGRPGSESAAEFQRMVSRLKAEGAAEAWRSLARNIRADSVFAKSARNPEFLDAFADEEIAEAARAGKAGE